MRRYTIHTGVTVSLIIMPDFPVNRVNTVRNASIPEKEPEISVFRKKGLKYRFIGKKPDTVNRKKYAYTVGNLKIYVPTYPYKYFECVQ